MRNADSANRKATLEANRQVDFMLILLHKQTDTVFTAPVIDEAERCREGHAEVDLVAKETSSGWILSFKS